MKKIKKGMFITIEGGEGSGKSTLAQSLYEEYKNKNYDVILTREPGGNDIA
jgi:dTMP kinase